MAPGGRLPDFVTQLNLTVLCADRSLDGVEGGADSMQVGLPCERCKIVGSRHGSRSNNGNEDGKGVAESTTSGSNLKGLPGVGELRFGDDIGLGKFQVESKQLHGDDQAKLGDATISKGQSCGVGVEGSRPGHRIGYNMKRFRIDLLT